MAKEPEVDKTNISKLKKGLSRRDFIAATACAGTAAASGIALSGLAHSAPRGPKNEMDSPTLSCHESTQVSITITVCAGVSGAPAGFSIQWMTLEDFIANGNQWSVDSGCIPGEEGCPASFCKASFSGNAHLSRYNLNPAECVEVNLGEFLFDNGASTSCTNSLNCGTAYVFRAFAHANSTLKRSAFTGNLICYTLPCLPLGGGCTFTQGYWKTHGPIPTGNNTNEWPVTELTLGAVTYTDLQLLSIFEKPAAGNGLIALAHQLIAAKLNVANGADDSEIASAIAEADALIGGLVIPPVGAGSLPSNLTSDLTAMLTDYNEGATGPGHCD